MHWPLIILIEVRNSCHGVVICISSSRASPRLPSADNRGPETIGHRVTLSAASPVATLLPASSGIEPGGGVAVDDVVDARGAGAEGDGDAPRGGRGRGAEDGRGPEGARAEQEAAGGCRSRRRGRRSSVCNGGHFKAIHSRRRVGNERYLKMCNPFTAFSHSALQNL